MTATKTKTSPGLARMKQRLGPKGTEALRQTVVADQARRRLRLRRRSGSRHPRRPRRPTRERSWLSQKRTRTPKASRRAKWFALLKTGMTVDQAVEADFRGVYLQRMAKGLSS